jgi:PAS domain S-box-containing protein
MAEAWQEEERFRILVEGVNDYAIFMMDPTGRILTWNPGAQRIKGYTAADILGKHFSIFYPESDLRVDKPKLELEIATREGRFEEEGWRLRKDGTRFWANVIITAIRDDRGAVRGFAKVTRDLTERREAEEQLRRSEERLRMLIDSIRDYAIFMLDPDGKVATWNAGSEALKGYRPHEILGKHFTIFRTEEDITSGRCDHELHLASATGRYEEEGWRLRKDRSRFWANVVITAIRDERKNLIGFAKVTRDLTERRRAEDERAARLAAEHANRAKDQFLAVLGHELRNPLAPIVTALHLMRDAPFPKERAIIERQVKHMTRLVDDLLDVSRVAAGKVQLQKHPVDLRAIVRNAVELASPLLEGRRHHVEVDLSEDSLRVDADESRLAQVFANLLTNAAKFTDPGGRIAVTARREGAEVVVEVADDGVGIHPDQLTSIFDMFVQAEQGIERPTGGLGIGLSLVRSLVKLHGGRVEAMSEGLGKGSRFVVRLPLLVSDGRAATITQSGRILLPELPTQRRVLIVDDNEDALALMAELLRKQGHDVRTASNGVAALEIAAELVPDVAILDIGLPVMDGYVLAIQLRETLGDRTPKLIALTGYGDKNDRERTAAAGFVAHLLKPVQVRQLIETIEKVTKAT